MHRNSGLASTPIHNTRGCRTVGKAPNPVILTVNGRLPEAARARARSIASTRSRRTSPKNTVIINEGDLTDSLYVINTGKVKIILSDEEGKEVIISILKEGDYFGELSLIDDEPLSACVMTMTPCQFSIIGNKPTGNIF